MRDCFFDPGKDNKDFVYFGDNPSATESIILRLISKITDNIFFDGWYSSISLLNKLTEKGNRNITVIRGNAKDFPSKIKKGGNENDYKNNIFIQKSYHKKDILFLSNYRISVDKLKDLYNIKNHGVDVFDQYLEIGSIQRATKKWYKNVLYFYIEDAIINSKIFCDKRYGKEAILLNLKKE